jgi:hypothetical protein
MRKLILMLNYFVSTGWRRKESHHFVGPWFSSRVGYISSSGRMFYTSQQLGTKLWSQRL